MNQGSLFELDDHAPSSPGDLLRELLAERGWTQEDLAFIAGTSRQTIAKIVANKSGITTAMALAFAAAFKNSASVWLRLDAMYRLSQAKKADATGIEQRARAYSIAPIREMQKRGWISDTKNVEEIETELLRFFGADSLDSIPPISAAAADCGEPREVRGRRDTNTLAFDIVQQATGERPPDGKNPAAVALGRLGGMKGGRARAAALSASKRTEIAKRAALARWQRDS